MSFIVSVVVFDCDSIELYNVRVRVDTSEEAKEMILEHIVYCYNKFGVDVQIVSRVVNPEDFFAETGSECSSDDEEEL
jgi:hypothetical protein